MNSHRVYHNTARYLANTRGTHTHTHIGWVAMRRAPHITIIHILLDTRGALVISYRISKIITDVAASLRGRFRASAGRVCVCCVWKSDTSHLVAAGILMCSRQSNSVRPSI